MHLKFQIGDIVNKKIMVSALVIAIIVAFVCLAFYLDWLTIGDGFATPMEGGKYNDDAISENFQWTKNVMIWFMLMLVAFLMIFIKKFEWGVALAVLLSAAGSYVAYLAIQDFYFDAVWNQALMIRAVICSITVVIAIGVFLGTVKMWHYLLIGILFAPVYALVEWMLGNISLFGQFATDPGGSILVHMCAAYFGLGVALTIRNKKAASDPMYTSTHSVTFVWLASMLLWVLWPAFVTSLLPPDMITWGTLTCYMAGIGSIISAYVVCMAIQKKVNPLTYTYALLAGPVAIGAALLVVGPWGALIIGILAGAISALCFIYLQPWFCNKLGVLDVMGVHNLHGMAGWVGALVTCVIVGSVTNAIMAVVVVALTLVFGGVIGLVCKYTMGKPQEIMTDDTDFIRNDEPESTCD